MRFSQTTQQLFAFDVPSPGTHAAPTVHTMHVYSPTQPLHHGIGISCLDFSNNYLKAVIRHSSRNDDKLLVIWKKKLRQDYYAKKKTANLLVACRSLPDTFLK